MNDIPNFAWNDPTGIIPEPPLTTRFAPSPTGKLHLGHAYSAWIAYQRAREAGGRFLLRIEDIDTTRCRPEYEDGILRDLEWLGLEWDGEVLRQSDRFDVYHEFIHVLEEGNLLYPCFCTRKDIQREIESAQSAPHGPPHGPDGPLYPGICKNLDWREAKQRIDSGEPHALRLHMDRAEMMTGPLDFTDELSGQIDVNGSMCGDIVLARKETPASYHLSCTVDDALQHVTLVTRGEELLGSTHIHRMLQALFGLPTPKYHHHKLIENTDGKRLTKRDKALSIESLRQSGQTPEQVWSSIGVRM